MLRPAKLIRWLQLSNRLRRRKASANSFKMRKFLVVYEKTKTGYSAYAPDLPGVIATGKTKEIIEKNIFEAIQFSY